MTSSTYNATLPQVFHDSVTLNKDDVAFWTQFLIENGSSFAVTVDRPYTLWLSKVSLESVLAKAQELKETKQ